MGPFLQDPTAQLVIWLAICAALVTIGIYVIARIRRSIHEDQPLTSNLMTNFREMYSQGELSDEEYQTIKNTLTNRFQRELKDSGQEG